MTRPAPDELSLLLSLLLLLLDESEEPVEDADDPKPVYTAVPVPLESDSVPVAVAVPDAVEVVLTRVGFCAPHGLFCVQDAAQSLLPWPQEATHWLLDSVHS